MSMKLLLSKLPPDVRSVIDALELAKESGTKESALQHLDYELENVEQLLPECADDSEVNSLIDYHQRLKNARIATVSYFK